MVCETGNGYRILSSLVTIVVLFKWGQFCCLRSAVSFLVVCAKIVSLVIQVAGISLIAFNSSVIVKESFCYIVEELWRFDLGVKHYLKSLIIRIDKHY